MREYSRLKIFIIVSLSDSLYMALAGETLDELVSPELRSQWNEIKFHCFPRTDTAEHVAYDKRTPGYIIN